MRTPPPDAQFYLPTIVTVRAEDAWVSGFEFCAIHGPVVHVITAWNPGDERPSSKINEELNEQLREEISARGLKVLEALGSDPDSSHAEKSWAVIGLSDSEAIELGREYRQIAIFRITETRQSVLGCFSEWEVGRGVNTLGLAVAKAKVQELRKSGDVMTQQIKWNPQNWQIPELAMFETQVSTFANRCQEVGDSRVILRGQVIDFSESFEDVFIGSMIFGHGLTGYGPSRVGRIIKENPDLIEKLHRQYAAAADSPEKSWASHTNEDKVKYLGPAFATKFAYFAARKQKVSGIIPLIADINTSWAIWRLAEIPRSVEDYESYSKYVKLAHDWGDELGCQSGVDEIERALFKIGINVRDQIKKSKK